MARVLSKMGYCSRSQAAVLICAGRVTLNGRIARDPERPVRMPPDRIAVDGVPLDEQASTSRLMNRRPGGRTTASDEKWRDRVYGRLEPALRRVGPLQRLAKA